MNDGIRLIEFSQRCDDYRQMQTGFLAAPKPPYSKLFQMPMPPYAGFMLLMQPNENCPGKNQGSLR
jgi:hypothetical protein